MNLVDFMGNDEGQMRAIIWDLEYDRFNALYRFVTEECVDDIADHPNYPVAMALLNECKAQVDAALEKDRAARAEQEKWELLARKAFVHHHENFTSPRGYEYDSDRRDPQTGNE